MSSTSKLWLIRHGPTHAKSFVGWTDVPADLSDTAAIARLEASLPHVPVISSDLDRAIKTADALQGARPRKPHDARLRETYFGDWEKLTWPQIETRDPALARAVFETPGSASPPNGESWNDFSARVHAGIDAIAGDAVVVAHMGVIVAIVQRALGCSAYEALGHKIDPLSLTIISRGATWHAETINRIP